MAEAHASRACKDVEDPHDRRRSTRSAGSSPPSAPAAPPPASLDGVRVDYYGDAHADQPDGRPSSVPDARTLVIQPWEAGAAQGHREGHPASPISASRPVNDGKVIRLTMPALTEERRKQLAKTVAQDGGGRAGRRAQHPPRGQRQAQGDWPRTRRSPRTRSAGATIRSRRPPIGSSPRSTSC